MTLFSERHDGALMVVAGGVAANAAVRAGLDQAAAAHGFRLAAPPQRLCTDNAVMVAWAGPERPQLGLVDGLDAEARPRWGLETLGAVNAPSPSRVGYGIHTSRPGPSHG